MNIDTIDLEQTVQRYVLGKLSEPEAEAFEAYFLDKPELASMIETAQNMHLGMEQADANARVNSAASGASQTGDRLAKWIKWFSLPIPAYAVLALAAIMAPMALNDSKQESSVNSINLVHFSTDTTRSSSAPLTVDLSRVAGDPALMVKLREVEYRDYRLKISSASSGEAIWASELFQVSALRDHLVVIPQEAAIADAVVQVVGIDSNDKETAVTFCHYSEVCR